MKAKRKDSLQQLREKYPGDPRYDAGAFARAVLDGTAPAIPEDDGLDSVREGDEVPPRFYEDQIGADRWHTLCNVEGRSDLDRLIFEEMDPSEIRSILYSLAYWRHRDEKAEDQWSEWVNA